MQDEFVIEEIKKDKYTILKLNGRIAADSSLRLIEAVNEKIKNGARDVILDIGAVDYISSAGVRVLLLSYKQLNTLKGSFALYRTTDTVKSLLNMMNLSELADSSKFELAMSGGHAVPVYGIVNGIAVDVLFRNDNASSVKIMGDIDKADELSCSAKDFIRLENTPKTIALGLGAFDTSASPMIDRAGEFISLCGFAAFMPSDGSKKAECLAAGNGLMPEINYLYCASGECDYSAAFTFKSRAADTPVKLSDIIKTAHSLTGRDNILAVIAGDIKGIVGSSPAVPPGVNRKNTADNYSAAPPRIKEKFILTGEQAYNGHIALCAGISSAKPVAPSSETVKFIRPLARESLLSGHFHAAVFAFTPLKKEFGDPAGSVRELYEKGAPEAVLHLTTNWSDDKNSGETEFTSGACWVVNLSGL